ncbi:hypothetical protein [Pantoea ananatis]|uniref:fimbrial protein n=1 Tax=Pantoea ananas TaxID=553 RepID=UPI00287D0EE3|nr:hypothetical protein [Pantoea ananatis]MDS7721608.1 hypothetical protein [Pantoea ananatis]
MNNVQRIIIFGIYVVSAAPAAEETFLPQHEVSFSGRIVAPSCQARLNTNKLTFHHGKVNEPRKQRVSLSLSECDISGLGVRFSTMVQPGHTERGVLKNSDNRPASNIWFTIGSLFNEENSTFSLSSDSTDLIKGEGNTSYFKLGQQNYWFEVDKINRGPLNFPFEVELHQKDNTGIRDNDDYSAIFSLQLSYR